MAKFSLTDLMSAQSKESSEWTTFKIEHIQLDKLHRSEMNKYIVQDVAELKASIELVGLQQNLLVRPKGDVYEVISGHRRLKAMQELYEEGNELFKKIPCKIMRTTDDIQAELQLLLANSTARELTDFEKTYQAARLQELLQDIESNGYKISGRKREIVAQLMGVSSSQIARMDSINKKLSPELKEEFSQGNINITTAYEISRLPEEQQQEVKAELEREQPLTPTIVKEKRAEQKEQPVADIIVEKERDSADIELEFKHCVKSIKKEFRNSLEALNNVSDSAVRKKHNKELFDLLEKMQTTLQEQESLNNNESELLQMTIFDE